MKIAGLLLLTLFLGIATFSTSFFAAATTHNAVSSPTPAQTTATPLPDVIGPDNYTTLMNPLTGLLVSDINVLNRRPLAIKVSNAPAIVRPQAGLSQADLVFEHYVEGRLTRFTAIFYSNTPSVVGSVRSARLIDLQLPIMYDALFAFSGANGPILLRIDESDFSTRAYENSGQPMFYRDPDIEIPHNLFSRPADIWNNAMARGLNQRPNLSGMTFHEAPPPNAVSNAHLIEVDYGPTDSQWEYQPESNQYIRSINDVPHVDALDSSRITADNVVIIWAHHQEDITVVENEWQGNQTFSTEIQIWTLGPATIFRDGLRYDGKWHRWEDEAMLSFWVDDTMTERLHLKPGVTWFQVVPLDFEGLVVQVVNASED